MAQKIVVCGSPSGGFSFYGPFPEKADVASWAEDHLRSMDWWVATIHPSDFFDKCICGDTKAGHEGMGFDGRDMNGACAYCSCRTFQKME